jgi:hypothetical protein
LIVSFAVRANAYDRFMGRYSSPGDTDDTSPDPPKVSFEIEVGLNGGSWSR